MTNGNINTKTMTIFIQHYNEHTAHMNTDHVYTFVRLIYRHVSECRVHLFQLT